MAEVQLNQIFEGINSRIGDMVFYRMNGKTFVRRRPVLNNPRTPAQQTCRAVFRDAVMAWRCLDGTEREYWNNRAKSENRTGYNAFISSFMRAQSPGQDTEI